VFSCDFNIKMLLFELDFEEVSKKKLRECWSQLCRIRCIRAKYGVLNPCLAPLLMSSVLATQPINTSFDFCERLSHSFIPCGLR